jgi:short-subunit dehydrogenase
VTTLLITGATGAIGAALAQAFAESGNTLILNGRDAGRLEALARRCEARGARVLTQALDVRDRPALAAWLRGLEETTPVDTAIVNAGVNINVGRGGEGERWAEVEELMEVNLLGALATVDALLPAMRRRGRGQIALMSSLAGWFGLPVTPSYCASKAALKAYGEALRGWLAPHGIRVSVVMPGYVDSAMSRAMPGPKPFMWTPERAARRIRRGLDRDQPRISFPFPLNWGTWWLAVLPMGLSLRILRRLGYHD